MRPTRALRRATLAALTTLSVAVLAACGVASADGETSATGTDAGDSTDVAASAGTGATTVADAMAENVDYTTGDVDVDTADAVDITLSGSTATSDSDAVSVAEDGTVTITAAGTYRLTGTLDGQVVVDSPDDGVVTLVLDGAEITSGTTSAIAFMDAGSAVVVLADGSSNTLTDAATYVYPDAETDEPNAALFSKADLTIGGDGELTVVGNANDGIGSKDGLVIAGGTISVTAVDDGVRGKDYLVVAGGELTVDAGDDGLKSDNDSDDGTGYVLLDGGTVTVDAGDDAVKGEAEVLVAGGDLTVATSYEGLEAVVVIIDDGTLSVTSSDDAVNAAGGSDDTETGAQGGGMEAADATYQVYINGGTLEIDADGDGLDSNGDLTVTGGSIVVEGPTNDGNGALDVAGSFTVTGGTIVASGSAGMAQAPGADSPQGWVAVTFDQAQAAGSTVTLLDADGAEVLDTVVGKQFASLVFSSADVTSGEQYTVLVDGVETATVTAGESAGGMGGGPGGGPGGGSGEAPGGGSGEPPAGPPGEAPGTDG